MARLFIRASNMYQQASLPTVPVLPLTLATWVYPLDNTNQQDIFCVTNTVQAGRDGYFIRLDGAVAGDPVSATTSTAGVGSNSAQTSPGYVLNQWQHAAAVFVGTAERYAYLNGANKASDTTSRAVSSENAVTVGSSLISGAASGSGGQCSIRLPAIWTAQLSDSEILQLAMGAHPRTIRPDSLLAYWELTGEGAGAISYGVGGPNGYNLLDKTAPRMDTSEPQIWTPGNREFGYWGAVIAGGSTLFRRSLDPRTGSRGRNAYAGL